MDEYKGKVVFITGGASGIGRAVAERFVGYGADVFIADVNPNGPAIGDDIGAAFVKLDVSDPQAWDAVIADVGERAGTIDLLHLNAGVHTSPTGEVIGDDPMRWFNLRSYRRILGINTDGVVLGLLAAWPSMQAAGRGDIIVTASVASLEPLVQDPCYSASKHAVVGFVRSFGPTAAKHGIRLQAICPGGVDSGLPSPDMRAGRVFAPPSYQADALEKALTDGVSGDVWVALRVGVDPWKVTFPNYREPPA